MKKNDVAALLVIVVVAGIFSYVIANALVGKPKNNPVQVEQVTSINETFPTPDSRVFNDQAVDPTVEINGDGQSADRPFAN